MEKLKNIVIAFGYMVAILGIVNAMGPLVGSWDVLPMVAAFLLTMYNFKLFCVISFLRIMSQQ